MRNRLEAAPARDASPSEAQQQPVSPLLLLLLQAVLIAESTRHGQILTRLDHLDVELQMLAESKERREADK